MGRGKGVRLQKSTRSVFGPTGVRASNLDGGLGDATTSLGPSGLSLDDGREQDPDRGLTCPKWRTARGGVGQTSTARFPERSTGSIGWSGPLVPRAGI